MVEAISSQFNILPIVAAAMGRVPRNMFLEYGLDHLAYLDRPLPIGAKQTISQPSTVAIQSTLLGVKRWSKVLEIGTGCGYQTAVLAEMGCRVYSIERQKSLYIKAQQNLARLEYHSPTLFYGDGFAGLPQFAPFSAILITCGAPSVPAELLKQLAVEGVMVVPVGEGGSQKMVVVRRVSQEEFVE